MSGVSEASLAAVRGFFDSLVETTVPVAGTREAEMTKLLENTFRHVNIALVNELAVYAGDLGIDVWAALDAAATKPFGFLSFKPGPGVGGHCLPIDPSYLSWRVRRSLGQTFRFVELANDVNEHMPNYVVKRLAEGLNRVAQASQRQPGAGAGFRLQAEHRRCPGESRVGRSSSCSVAPEPSSVSQTRTSEAWALVEDEFEDGTPATLVPLTEAEIEAADAVVLVTDHDAFDLDRVVARAVLCARHPGPASPVRTWSDSRWTSWSRAVPGFIGSHVCRSLRSAGSGGRIVVLDDFSTGTRVQPGRDRGSRVHSGQRAR